MKKILLGLAAALAVSVSFPAMAQDKIKVCFVYVGSKTDGGWTQAHEIGRQLVDKELGDKIETTFLENVAEGPDAERAIERFARSGCDIVFTTSFGFMDQTVAVAAKFPDVKFEHATGYKTAPNLTTYNSRFYEGRYIIGQIAAKMSKTGVAGYIASFPIPEVVQGINAFVLGAQSVNPDFKLKVVWVNTWFDAGKEADAAKALIDQGVDIITQHTDSTAPMQVAEERGIHAFGQAFDMIQAGPEVAAYRDHRHLGSLLCEAHPGGARRHLERWRGELGRPEGRYPDHGALYQHARRREEDGRGDRSQDQVGRGQALHRSRSPSRTARSG